MATGEGDGRGRVRCDEPMFFFSVVGGWGSELIEPVAVGGFEKYSFSVEVYF